MYLDSTIAYNSSNQTGFTTDPGDNQSHKIFLDGIGNFWGWLRNKVTSLDLGDEVEAQIQHAFIFMFVGSICLLFLLSAIYIIYELIVYMKYGPGKIPYIPPYNPRSNPNLTYFQILELLKLEWAMEDAEKAIAIPEPIPCIDEKHVFINSQDIEGKAQLTQEHSQDIPVGYRPNYPPEYFEEKPLPLEYCPYCQEDATLFDWYFIRCFKKRWALGRFRRNRRFARFRKAKEIKYV